MKQTIQKWGLVLLAALPLTGCIDKNYDLDDIDTTMRFSLKELTVPVNLDSIKLKDIFSLNPDDPNATIRVVDGKYAVVKNGTFTSSPIFIDRFTISAPKCDPVTAQIPILGDGEYEIATPATAFSGSAYSITADLTRLYGISTDFDLVITPRLIETAATGSLRNGVFSLIKGMTATSRQGSYDSDTGELTLGGDLPLGESVTLHVTRIDTEKAGVEFNAEHHTALFRGECSLKEGKLNLQANGARQATFDLSFTFGEIPALAVDARFKSNIGDVDVSDVMIDGIPAMLNNDETNLILDNPQIHLSLRNPLQDLHVYASSGLTITAHRDNGAADRKFSPDPNRFSTSLDHQDGIYNFCMSPVFAEYEGYPDSKFVPFPSMENILSGEGLPKRLTVDLDDPTFPEQDLIGLPMGKDLGAAEGHFTFFVPLALKPGSLIVYSDTMDGWSQDLDSLVVQKLVVDCDALNQLPVDLEFQGYPIDSEGKRINNVEITGAKLAAGAEVQHLTLQITGEIRGIDGLTFVAYARSEKEEIARQLTPQMSIILTKIRPTITGYYQKEF